MFASFTASQQKPTQNKSPSFSCTLLFIHAMRVTTTSSFRLFVFLGIVCGAWSVVLTRNNCGRSVLIPCANRYHTALDEASRAKVRLATATGATFALVKLGSNAIMAAICAYGGYLVKNGDLTSGDVAKLLAQVRVAKRAKKKQKKQMPRRW